MTPINPSPDRLGPAVEFWLDVQRDLQTEFDMPADQAREAIEGYSRRMAEQDALDVVYHSEPREIAIAIHGGRFRMALPSK